MRKVSTNSATFSQVPSLAASISICACPCTNRSFLPQFIPESLEELPFVKLSDNPVGVKVYPPLDTSILGLDCIAILLKLLMVSISIREVLGSSVQAKSEVTKSLK